MMEKVCSEDGYFEENSRHPLKCDKNRQLPPMIQERFLYNRFSQYVRTKFLVERQTRKSHVFHDQEVLPIEHYTDAVLKKELFDIYGEMDEGSTKFRLIFTNYKEERVQQILKWIEDEEQYILSKEKSNYDNGKSVPPGEIDVCQIVDMFASEEVSEFESIANYKLAKLDPFILPRVPLNEHSILKKYGHDEKKHLISLTEFDPEVNIIRMTIPDICDMNVGEKLTERMVEIISKHPTGITNTNFLMEFKRKAKYYPDPSDMNYSSFGEMMKDLGNHMILIQNLSRVDNFYYPMCLQGLVCAPIDMFWNIWHKLKVVLNIHSGIVKVSKALKFCQQLFGWGMLDIKAWGFESDILFVEFLITQWSNSDIVLIPESMFKSQGCDHVKYLVLMTAARKKYLYIHSSKIKAKPVSVGPSSCSQAGQPKTYRQQLCTSQSQYESSRPRVYQKQLSDPRFQSKQPNTHPQQQQTMSQYDMAKLYEPQQKIPSQISQPKIDQQLGRINKSSRAPIVPQPKAWSSLFKK